jgi:hypothetical protein
VNDLSTEQYEQLAAKIYSQLGLQFDEKKFSFLQKRVARPWRNWISRTSKSTCS